MNKRGSGRGSGGGLQRQARAIGRRVQRGLETNARRGNRSRSSSVRDRRSSRRRSSRSRYSRYDRGYGRTSSRTSGANTGAVSCFGFLVGGLLILAALALWLMPLVAEQDPLAEGAELHVRLGEMGMEHPGRLPLFMGVLGVAVILVGYIFAIISTLLNALLTRIARAIRGTGRRRSVHDAVDDQRSSGGSSSDGRSSDSHSSDLPTLGQPASDQPIPGRSGRGRMPEDSVDRGLGGGSFGDRRLDSDVQAARDDFLGGSRIRREDGASW